MRPSKLENSRTREKLLRAIEEGFTYRAACSIAGITEATLASYKRKCQASDAPRHKKFLLDLERAYETALANLENVVRKAARVDDKVALKILARRNPEQWSERRGPRTVIRIDESTLRKGRDDDNDVVVQLVPDDDK